MNRAYVMNEKVHKGKGTIKKLLTIRRQMNILGHVMRKKHLGILSSQDISKAREAEKSNKQLT